MSGRTRHIKGKPFDIINAHGQRRLARSLISGHKRPCNFFEFTRGQLRYVAKTHNHDTVQINAAWGQNIKLFTSTAFKT